MFVYEKKLQYPVKIKSVNPKLAAQIISQYGGPECKRVQFFPDTEILRIGTAPTRRILFYSARYASNPLDGVMVPSPSTNRASTPGRLSMSARPFSFPRSRQVVDRASPLAESSDTMLTAARPLSAGKPVSGSRMW